MIFAMTSVARFLTVLLFALSFFSTGNTQTTHDLYKEGFDFLPEGLHFSPLKANAQEARIGVFKYFGTANLKVDIGNTIDIFGYNTPDSKIRAAMGIDFMAYAFVTGAQGLRLQVDALDGFFGGNVSLSKQYEHNLLQFRLRILHLSAHLVDGHYELGARRWIDNREPIPFTKDFGELVAAHVLNPDENVFRYYGGISYATLVRPTDLKRFGFLVGFEIGSKSLFGSVFSKPATPFLAAHFVLAGLPEYTGSIQTQFGVKFGEWNRKGVVFYLSHFNGNNLFSEYFDERVSIWGAGFTVDFN